MKHLDDLNEQQKEAVLHNEGPLMIVAGAGSGKTKVITTRIAHLIQNGADPFNILALTFTNKAAAEMKERIVKILLNTEARNLYIGTFHSVFARILRVEANKIGFPNNFTIYDTDDAKSVVKTVIKEMDLDDKIYKPNTIYNRISSAKNALVGPQEYAIDTYLQQEDSRANRPLTGKIYQNYSMRCFKNGAMDFDDLLYQMYLLLTNNLDVLSKYQRRFKYVMIDEYQDTNPAQYEIIKLLGAQYENVCVVGDDAQSIYSFRGATIENILLFRKDYEDVKVIKLEQNYRSSDNILKVANQIISFNKNQIEKNLFTTKEPGDKIKLVKTMTDNDEGRYVADIIQEQKLRYHFYNKDFAILYRTNAQSRAYEESLRRMGIAYKIYGGLSFYQRKEVKDIIAYLRLIVNLKDEEALKRIINYPVRGIGKTTIDKLVLIANENNLTMWEVLCNAAMYGFKSNTLVCIDTFVLMIKMFQSELPKRNAYEIAFLVGKNTGLVKDLFNDKTTEGLARYENIQALLNSIKEFVDTAVQSNTDEDTGEINEDANPLSLGSYLQQITLLTDNDKTDDNEDVVKLMTIHAAKGLEFEVVFLGGLEETLFPSGMSVNTREELEEERRLFYVAITRAKQKLWLTYANARYRFGQLQQNEPSRFIEEMPTDLVDSSFNGMARNNASNSGGLGTAYERMNRGFASNLTFNKNTERPNQSNTMINKLPTKTVVVEHKATANFIASDIIDMKEGHKVEHQKFGFGNITKLEGAMHNKIATILFNNNGEKKIMLNYAKLRIVED